ncbi:MAG: nucleotidyltransferase substrate binding protein [Stellaceae bacterium]
MKKSESLREDFAAAVTRLEQAPAFPKDDIVRDCAIQRFEISFELCWKYLKAFLRKSTTRFARHRGLAFARRSRMAFWRMTLSGST